MKPDDGYLSLERLNSADAPELHRAVDAAKRRVPDAQQLAALAASLSQIGITVARGEHTAATSAPSTTGLKLLIGAGALGPLALAFWLLRPQVPQSTPPPNATSAAVERAVSPRVEAPSGTAVGSTPGRAPLAGAAASLEASSPAPASSGSSTPPDSERAPPPIVGQAPVRSHPQAAAAATPTPDAVRSPVAPDRANPVSSSVGVVSRPTEVALLRDAQLALRSSPSEALALTEQHRALFARGAMIQERELIAISALARLGRHSAVLARAAQFERDFPNSPYRKQINALAQ